MQTTVTLDLKLSFAPGIKVDANELLVTVPETLLGHDRRLLPAAAPTREGERLAGTGVKIAKVDQEKIPFDAFGWV
jgi:hypothetical protein